MDNILAFLFFAKFVLFVGTIYSIASIVYTIIQHIELCYTELYCRNIFTQHQWRAFYKRSKDKYSYIYTVLFILLSIFTSDSIIKHFTNDIIYMPDIINLIFNLSAIYNIVIGIWYLKFQITLHSCITKNTQEDIPNQIARIIVSKRIKLPSRNYLLYLGIESNYQFIIKSKNTFIEILLNAFDLCQEAFEKGSIELYTKNKKINAPLSNIGYYIAYMTLMCEYLIEDINAWKIESENFNEVTNGFINYINLSEVLPMCLENTKKLKKPKYTRYINSILSDKSNMEYFLKNKKHRVIPCIWDD